MGGYTRFIHTNVIAGDYKFKVKAVKVHTEKILADMLNYQMSSRDDLATVRRRYSTKSKP